jgi:hypothetical protein
MRLHNRNTGFSRYMRGKGTKLLSQKNVFEYNETNNVVNLKNMANFL